MASTTSSTDGIWAQGGTDGVLKAFKEAGRPLPPTAGESENGFRKFMIGAEGGASPDIDAEEIIGAAFHERA